MSNKIIKEDDAIGIINYKDNIDNKIKLELNKIVNTSYIIDNCDYVLQIDSNNYKGDLMCVCSLFDTILDRFKSNNLLSYVEEFYVQKEYIDNGTKKYIGEDFLNEQ